MSPLMGLGDFGAWICMCSFVLSRGRDVEREKLKDDVHLLLFIYHIIDRLAESVFCPKICRWASSPRH